MASLKVQMRSLYWDFMVTDSVPHIEGEADPYLPRNPVVLLAHDAWSQLPQQLYAVHYGKLLRARLSLISAGEARLESEQLWSPVDPAEWGDALHPLLRRYLHEFNSSPIVFPSAGIAVIDKIAAMSDGRALILSVGDGYARDLNLRLSSFADVIGAYRKSSRFPVNFQLIAAWTRARGGAVIDVTMSSGETLQLQLMSHSSTEERLQAIARCVDSALFSSSHHLIEACAGLGSSVSLATRLNLLQMSRHDPKVFAAADRQILQALRKNITIDRDAWRPALEKVWENHLMYPSDDSLPRRIAAVAMYCNHWGFARSVLRHELTMRGDNADDLSNLAWCEARTGRLTLAKELVTCALQIDGSSELAREIDRRVSDRMNARDEQWLVELRHPELPLVLEPLDDSHADAYCRQYRDPQIAVMTGLPALKTVDEVREWIHSQDEEKGRVNFAVMHADWGFVGFINLAVSEHAAFFCFWTGVDYQGSGFATAAGRLVCAYAATQGVPLMLTSAYKDNHRSIRALGRIGFQEMKIRACPPDQDRIFFSLFDPASGEFDDGRELVDYYARENLPMRFEGYPDHAVDGGNPLDGVRS